MALQRAAGNGALDAGQTTFPSADTDAATRSSLDLLIHWVCPEEGTTPTRIDAERVLLGRGEDCHQELPGRETSRHHAEIRSHGRVTVLRDLGSTNGIHVNGERVAEAPLQAGDVVRLGEWVGIVVADEPADGSPEDCEPVAADFFVGPALARAIIAAKRAASSDLPIVICGETGTGKECVARAIHGWSGREGAFVAINCAALPEGLAEAELFGFRAGAFTGAVRSSDGHFRAAARGTLLLDELAELPLATQAKLLRAVEHLEVTPLGDSRPVATSARIVAATQQPLERAVAERCFRPDLFARLAGVTITLPPLRHRRVEVPFLFTRLLIHHAGGPALAPKADARLIEALCLYDWPFNVRELDLLVRRLLVLHGQGHRLERKHLPEGFTDGRAPARAGAAEGEPPAGAARREASRDPAAAASGFKVRDPRRDASELDALLEALRVHQGNVSRAAQAIGLSRQRAYRLMSTVGDVGLAELRRGRDGAEEQEEPLR